MTSITNNFKLKKLNYCSNKSNKKNRNLKSKWLQQLIKMNSLTIRVWSIKATPNNRKKKPKNNKSRKRRRAKKPRRREKNRR